MRRRESCPNCGRSMDKVYSWRNVLRSILCFPCQFFCFRQRCRPTGYGVQRCKACNIKVVRAGGGVPDIARSYRTFNDFSWQFEESPRFRPDGSSSASGRREDYRRTGDLPANFSTSTQLSYATANENFDRDSAAERDSTTASFRTTTTAMTTPPVVEDNSRSERNNNDDNKLVNNKNPSTFNNRSNNSLSDNSENYRTANQEFAEKAKELSTENTVHDNNNNNKNSNNSNNKAGGIQNDALEMEDSV